MRKRRSAQRVVLHLLQRHASRRLSYDAMELATGYDRRTLITAVQYLEAYGQIRIERGRGRTPNRYEVL